MGNICSKDSNQPDNFSTPGRTVGSVPPNASTAPVPKKVTASGPGRTLGGADSSSNTKDPRQAARDAAEERQAQANNKAAGKLGTQLAAQKKQTQNQILKEASETERRHQEMDQKMKAATES